MKDCKCCREVGYNERVVTLHSCYDQDGLRLQGSLAQMQVGSGGLGGRGELGVDLTTFR